MDKFADL